MKDRGNYFEYVGGSWSNTGKFAFLEAPGNYVVEVNPYPNRAYSAGSPVTTRNLDCVVPETGAAVCNVALATGNFLGRVITPGGTTVVNSYVSMNLIQTGATQNTDSKFSKSKFGTQVNMYAGLFSAGLADGSYTAVVVPGWNSTGGYTQRSYQVDVSGSTINVSDVLTKQKVSVNPASGRFDLALGVASVTGKVFQTSAETSVISWGNVVAVDVATGNELWQYSSSTNMNGEYAITLPAGTYDLVARSWGGKGGSGSSSSAPRRITIDSSGVLVGESSPINLSLRDPNTSLKVVLPGTTTGVPYAYVNGYFNDKYFGGMTDGSGNFTAFVETGTASSCVATCSITVFPNGNSNLVAKSYPLTILGELGNLALGAITSKLSIRVPTNGDAGIPDKWAWAEVSELNGAGATISSNGYGSNELGQIGLGLVEGHKYRITAYPSGEYYGRYSAKSLDIAAFDPATQSRLTITFDSPNVTFIAVDRNGDGNSWGWYEVESKTADTYAPYVNGNLNDQGRGAAHLEDGTYRMTFYPGKAIGVTRVVTFTVISGHVATTPTPVGISFTNDVGRVVLAAGNISGTVRSNDNSALANIPVVATSVREGTSDTSTVTAVTKADGTYEMYLDPTRSWNISAVDPLTAVAKSAAPLASGFSPSSNPSEDIKFD
jgi:hypothetical protein